MKGMTQEHLSALCAAGEAKKNDQGFLEFAEGRSLTLYVASGGSTLSISRVQSLKQDGTLADGIAALLRDLSENPARRMQMAQAARALAKVDAAERIADIILEEAV